MFNLCQVQTHTIAETDHWPLQYMKTKTRLHLKILTNEQTPIITVRAMRMRVQIVHVNGNSFDVLLSHLCVGNS